MENVDEATYNFKFSQICNLIHLAQNAFIMCDMKHVITFKRKINQSPIPGQPPPPAEVLG
jgi:hypothetical protein